MNETPRTADQQPPSENMMLLVGQLVEATRRISESMKTIAQEQQNHARAILAVNKSLEQVEEDTEKLTRMVSGAEHDDPSLLKTAHVHSGEITVLRDSLETVKETLRQLRKQVDRMNDSDQRRDGARSVWTKIWTVGNIVLTIAIAIWAAYSAWKQANP